MMVRPRRKLFQLPMKKKLTEPSRSPMTLFSQIFKIEKVLLTKQLAKSGDLGRIRRLSVSEIFPSPTRRLLLDPLLLLLSLSELSSSAASFLISKERRSLKRLEEHLLTPRELLKRLEDQLNQ